MTDSAREIENLIYTYAERIDAGDLHGVAGLFAHGRIYGVANGRPETAFEGTSRVRQMYEMATRIYDDGTPKTKHLTTNVQIYVDETDETATGTAYYCVLQTTPDLPLLPDHVHRSDRRYEPSPQVVTAAQPPTGTVGRVLRMQGFNLGQNRDTCSNRHKSAQQIRNTMSNYNPTMQKAHLADVEKDVHGLISKRSAELDGLSVTQVTFDKGARWSSDLKEYAGTELCELPHVALVISGSLGVQMADGSEDVFTAGDVMLLPPGHDAWSVGDEACTFVEFSRGNDYYA